jgi:hypothetical protein
MAELRTSVGYGEDNECFYCGSNLSTCCGLNKFGKRRNCHYCHQILCSKPKCSVNRSLLVTDGGSGSCCIYCRDFYFADAEYDDPNILMEGQLTKRDVNDDACTCLVTMRRDTVSGATISWSKLPDGRNPSCVCARVCVCVSFQSKCLGNTNAEFTSHHIVLGACTVKLLLLLLSGCLSICLSVVAVVL